MKIFLTILTTAILIACGDGSPAPSKTSQCGCSKYNKADCQQQSKCKWVVNDGCKCA